MKGSPPISVYSWVIGPPFALHDTTIAAPPKKGRGERTKEKSGWNEEE